MPFCMSREHTTNMAQLGDVDKNFVQCTTRLSRLHSPVNSLSTTVSQLQPERLLSGIFLRTFIHILDSCGTFSSCLPRDPLLAMSAAERSPEVYAPLADLPNQMQLTWKLDAGKPRST
jgi:hypothetical protein